MKSDNKTQNSNTMESKPAINNQKELSGRFFDDEQRETIFTEITQRLIEGEPIGQILNSDRQKYPSVVTFFKWMDKYPKMQSVYRYVRESQTHALFDELLQVAKGDNSEVDTVVKVQRDRLITDTMKFYIAKVLPKVYGEKVDITSNGEALNIVSLGVGIAPAQVPDQQYIDITEGTEQTE